MTEVRCPLNEAACISQNQPAIMGKHGALLYSEVEQCVGATEVLLKQAGCLEGQRVVLLLMPGWEVPVLIMALIRIGAVVCPLDPRIRSNKLDDLVRKLGAQHLITTEARAEKLSDLGVHIIKKTTVTGFISKLDPRYHAKIDMDQLATIVSAKGVDGTSCLMAHSFGNHYYSAKGANTNMRLGIGTRWLVNIPPHKIEGLAIFFRCFL